MAETLRDRVAQIIMQQAQQPLIPTARPVSALEGNAAAYSATDAILALVAASPAAEPGVELAIAAAVAAFGPLVDNAGGYDRSNLRVLIMDAPISETEKNRYREMEEAARKAWRALGRLVPQTPASGEGE